jgi:hypothetical protein
MVGVSGAAMAAISQGAAAVSSSSASAPTYFQKDDCGSGATGSPVIGNVRFYRQGNVVTLAYQLTGASANTQFLLALFRPSGTGCTSVGFGPLITTDANGNAATKAQYTVLAGQTQFFATSFNFSTNHYNDTTTVNLP